MAFGSYTSQLLSLIQIHQLLNRAILMFSAVYHFDQIKIYEESTATLDPDQRHSKRNRTTRLECVWRFILKYRRLTWRHTMTSLIKARWMKHMFARLHEIREKLKLVSFWIFFSLPFLLLFSHWDDYLFLQHCSFNYHFTRAYSDFVCLPIIL